MERENKLVIDTNVWVSWLIGKRNTHLNKILPDTSIRIFTSAEQIRELFEVIERSKLSKFISQDSADEFKVFFIERTDIVTVRIKVKASRDHKDDYLLALSKTVNADFLITGDKDLLIVGKFGRTQIVTIVDYLSSWKS